VREASRPAFGFHGSARRLLRPSHDIRPRDPRHGSPARSRSRPGVRGASRSTSRRGHRGGRRVSGGDGRVRARTPRLSARNALPEPRRDAAVPARHARCELRRLPRAERMSGRSMHSPRDRGCDLRVRSRVRGSALYRRQVYARPAHTVRGSVRALRRRHGLPGGTRVRVGSVLGTRRRVHRRRRMPR
jgi:hypothetical protein